MGATGGWCRCDVVSVEIGRIARVKSRNQARLCSGPRASMLRAGALPVGIRPERSPRPATWRADDNEFCSSIRYFESTDLNQPCLLQFSGAMVETSERILAISL